MTRHFKSNQHTQDNKKLKYHSTKEDYNFSAGEKKD